MDREGNPWFVAKDIAKILGINHYRNTIYSFPKDEYSILSIVLSKHSGGNGEKMPHKILILNLFGVFRLIIQARNKPEANRFKDYLIRDFLPKALAKGWEQPPNDVLPGPDEMRGGCYTVNGERVFCYKGKIYEYAAAMHEDMYFDLMWKGRR